MPTRISHTQREQVRRLLAEGQDRETIAATVGVTPGQVSAVAAHVKMGTYAMPDLATAADHSGADKARAQELLNRLNETPLKAGAAPRMAPILLGDDVETSEAGVAGLWSGSG